MPPPITFKEPVSCDYLYIDDSNRVHLMLPIVGGDEIGLDNTCKTALELRRFFFGGVETDDSVRPHRTKTYQPVVEILKNYIKTINEDIRVVQSAPDYSEEDKASIINKKTDRLNQILEYTEYIKSIKTDQDIKDSFHPDITYPFLPRGVNVILQNAKNAFAIQLAPLDEDPAVRFKKPLFSVKRKPRTATEHYQLSDGLGFQLRTGFTPQGDSIPIKGRSPKDIIIRKVLDKIGEHRVVTESVPEGVIMPDQVSLITFDDLKRAIADELRKVDENDAKITDEDARLKIDFDNARNEINFEYARDILAYDSDTSISEWIDGLISTRITKDEFWSQIPSSIFYDIPGNRLTKEGADSLSIKVQFFLGEINGYCKMHDLSVKNFGAFFDQEPNGSRLAAIVKQGLIDGESIEALIFNEINQYHQHLGLTIPLTPKQQEYMVQKFTEHYRAIKGSPHFDEFLIANPDLPGSIYSHRGKMCVHFKEFYFHQQNPETANQMRGRRFRPKSNRLYNKNINVIRDTPCVMDLMRQIGEGPGIFLERLLSANQTYGVPMYRVLTDEQRQTICLHYKWTSIERQIAESNTRCKSFWSIVSKKPLLQEELSAISGGLRGIVASYEKNRSMFFIQRKSRKKQCSRLIDLATEIELLNKNTLSETEILSQVLKAMHVLDQILKEIEAENNSHPSQLQKEIREMKDQLIHLCEIQPNVDLPMDVITACQKQKETQLNKITSPDIRALVEPLPAHCQTNHAIQFFNTLSLQEMQKIANFLQLKYREFGEQVDNGALLQDVAETFKQVNQQQLVQFKQAGKLSQMQYEKLMCLAPHIRPELLSEDKLPVWVIYLEHLPPAVRVVDLDEENPSLEMYELDNVKDSIDKISYLDWIPKDEFSLVHIEGMNHPDFLQSVAGASDALAVKEIMREFGQDSLNKKQACIDKLLGQSVDEAIKLEVTSSLLKLPLNPWFIAPHAERQLQLLTESLVSNCSLCSQLPEGAQGIVEQEIKAALPKYTKGLDVLMELNSAWWHQSALSQLKDLDPRIVDEDLMTFLNQHPPPNDMTSETIDGLNFYAISAQAANIPWDITELNKKAADSRLLAERLAVVQDAESLRNTPQFLLGLSPDFFKADNLPRLKQLDSRLCIAAQVSHLNALLEHTRMLTDTHVTQLNQYANQHPRKAVPHTAQHLALAGILLSSQSSPPISIPIPHVEEGRLNVVSSNELLSSSLNLLNQKLNKLLDANASTSENPIINRLVYYAPPPWFFGKEDNQKKFSDYLGRYQVVMATIQELLNGIAASLSEEGALTDTEWHEIIASLQEFKGRFEASVVAPIAAAQADRLAGVLSQCKDCIASLERMSQIEHPSIAHR